MSHEVFRRPTRWGTPRHGHRTYRTFRTSVGGVDRRRFLIAGLSLSGIAYACVSAGARAAARTTTDTPPVVVREAGLPGWPLFEWEQPGGFFNPGEGVMQPPQLAVYADGTAYADAAARLPLPPVWVTTLHDQALGVLTTPAELVRDPDKPPPGDRPFDQVRVRTPSGGYLRARLEGWQDGDPQHAYPPPVRELYQQVEAIRRHVLHAGTPWRPSGVMLGVVSIDYRPDHCRDWPEGLPMPGKQLYQEIRLPHGPHGLPRATEKVWPMYRVGSNRFVAATWRRLLPHEIT
jgi:hypothetical protein